MKEVSKIYEEYSNKGEKKETKKKKAWADPLVIAEAWSVHGTVVTEELRAKKDGSGKAQGMPKIPDVCRMFSIRCISMEECMKELRWVF